MDRVDCVVAGAGVVGLAVARALARSGREVVVLEREGLIGGHTSSRNSEVIHAGIYYARGSAKARLCVRGKHLLYEHCASRGVPHRRLGKIIVATADEQAGALDAIDAAARGNGVEDLQPLDRAGLARLEPALRGVAGLLSPSTGIVDSHALMLSYLGEAEDHGAMVAFNARLRAARPAPAAGSRSRSRARARSRGSRRGSWSTRPGSSRARWRRRSRAGGPLAAGGALLQGQLLRRRGRVPFSRLIYPVPERDGLGVHLTLDLAGAGRFGPDTQWVEGIDYGLDASRGEGFYAAIRRYWPGLRDGTLSPSYTGIRPKLHPEGGPATDFAIEGRRSTACPGWSTCSASRAPA
jgi:L-2-hydroxyglutarate oxidase LhgO